ncbi:hypothetical protein MPTK1_4g15120 [Marchantia polymorpha subsp. ruderalis]|nr:hypothetical protein MARPO_0119s0035 [Marchantia polymorpha]BBN08869.1 hypothetical protein Mp_4g15120 [Marchantia polymorpha subsp. ruderalis]|eukprot:PTQ30835.1 hypothetical protein MARPO_0119s0035 [Marchantia polymorpha]
MFNRQYQLEDTHSVGQIFRGWQGNLHVELEGYPPHSSTVAGLKLPMISAPEKTLVEPSTVRNRPLSAIYEDADMNRELLDKPSSSSPKQCESILPGQQGLDISPVINAQSQAPADALDDAGTQKSSDGRNSSEKFYRDLSQDVVLQQQSGADGQGNVTVETGLDTALDALLSVMPEGPLNAGAKKDPVVDYNGLNLANKDAFGGAQGSTQSTPRNLENQFSGDSGVSSKRKRQVGKLLKSTSSGDLPADQRLSLPEYYKQDGGSATKKSRMKEKSDKGIMEIDGSLVNAIPDPPEKTVDGKNDIRAGSETSSSESGSERQEVKASPKRADKFELLHVTSPPKGNQSAAIPQGKMVEEDVVKATQGGKLPAELPSRPSRSLSSGSSTSQSSDSSEAKENLEINLPIESAKPQEEASNANSSSGHSSKSYRPDGSTGTREVDEVVNKLVDLYSPILSDDSGGEESSDASEELQAKGLRRRKSSNVVDQAYDTVERKGRRSPRGVSGLNYKFQHFIDSQDGLDELLGLTLSQRKPKTTSQVEHEPQLQVAEVGSLAHDSLSIDRVPDTQLGGASCDVGTQRDIYTEEIMHHEKTPGKESKSGDDKRVEDGSLDVRQDERDEKRSKSKQPARGSDANDIPPESLKQFANIASESGRKLDPNEDLLPPKSDDSQQFQAAVQLTRLAMADEDEAESDPMQSPRNSPIEKRKKKKKKTKVKLDTSIAEARDVDEPDNIENSRGIESARSGLAAASNGGEKESASVQAEHLPESGLNSTIVQAVPERPISDALEKSVEEVNALVETGGMNEKVMHGDDLEQPLVKGRMVGADSVDEDLGALDRTHDSIELDTPSKPLRKKKKKLSSRRNREEKENELDVLQTRGDEAVEEPPTTTKKTEIVANSVEDSLQGAEGHDEPYIIEPGEKSGRKKKSKKSFRVSDSSENERRGEMLSRSLMEENETWNGRGSDKKESLRRRLEVEEFGAEDVLGGQIGRATVISPQKKKKKKSKGDGEKYSVEGEFASADDAPSRVTQAKLSNAGLVSETSDIVTDRMDLRGDSRAFPEGMVQHVMDEENRAMSPVAVSKKGRKKKVSFVEEEIDVELEQKQSDQVTSDVEPFIQVSDIGQTKPPRPRKKSTNQTDSFSPLGEKASLQIMECVVAAQSDQYVKLSRKKEGKEARRRKLVGVEILEEGGKQPDSPVKEADGTELNSAGKRPFVENEKRKVKQRKSQVIDEVIQSDVENVNSSPAEENGLKTNEGSLEVDEVENSFQVSNKGTPTHTKRSLAAAEEDADPVISNQEGNRGTEAHELEGLKGHPLTRQAKRRGRNAMSDVDQVINAPSPTVEKSGRKTPKSKKGKSLKSPRVNGDAGETIKFLPRGAGGRFVSPITGPSEEKVPCEHPGCTRSFPRRTSSLFRHLKFCSKRPDRPNETK